MDDLKKKYKPMENVLNYINSNAISLPANEKGRNNKILEQVIGSIVNLMKRDQLFAGMYERNFYGGSYYDNLKVGQPNEYDLDLVLNLPILSKPCVECTDQPGFVKILIQDYMAIMKRPDVERKRFEKINTLLDTENHLSTNKVLKWMESVITTALNEIRSKNEKNGDKGTYVDVTLDKTKPDEIIRIYVTMSKGAPAFTFKLSGIDAGKSNIQLDVDLVPCFQFTDKNWPDASGGYRQNTSTQKDKYLVVPKKPKGEIIEKSPYLEKYWRLSFQEQERELISQDQKTLKPAIKLLKKLRDRHAHKIASYFIKTIFLWQLDELKNNTKEKLKFDWNQPLSFVFMYMLKKYAQSIRDDNLPYYWNCQFNLIGHLKPTTKSDIANNLENIIANVEKNLVEPFIDPCVIGKYLLLPTEFETLKEKVPLGKKLDRTNSCAATNNILNNSVSVDTPDSAVDSPPLLKLGFEPTLVQTHIQYLDSFEERQRASMREIMSQISSNGVANNNDVLTCLKKIDEKMDKLLDKFDQTLEDNRNTNFKIIALEEQMKQLQLENRSLRSRINETQNENINSIDAFLSIRQVESNNISLQ